jgi:hypothetical protein
MLWRKAMNYSEGLCLEALVHCGLPFVDLYWIFIWVGSCVIEDYTDFFKSRRNSFCRGSQSLCYLYAYYSDLLHQQGERKGGWKMTHYGPESSKHLMRVWFLASASSYNCLLEKLRSCDNRNQICDKLAWTWVLRGNFPRVAGRHNFCKLYQSRPGQLTHMGGAPVA